MPQPPSWWRSLLRRQDGRPYTHRFNVGLAVRDDPAFRGRLRWGARDVPEGRDLPWRPGSGWARWTDLDDLCLALWLQERGFHVRPAACSAGVRMALEHLIPDEEVQ